MANPKSLRRTLRILLDQHLAALEDQKLGHRTKAHQITLMTALEGLENLEYGQVDPIFTPAPTKLHGQFPAARRKLHIQAVRYVSVLTDDLGWSVPKAKAAVALAYRLSPESVEVWRQIYKKLPADPIMIGTKVIGQPTMIKFPVDEAGILEGLKVTGEAFVKAQKRKKTK